MKCPRCGSNDTRVIDSRPAEDGSILRRRRSCDSCGLRFTTHERVHYSALIVVKKDGRREEFNPDKLRSGIVKACNKLPVATADITKLIDDVEAALRQEAGSEISSERMGEVVMERLFNLNQVAYVRFASVYQRFDDVRRFAQLLERMSRRTRRRGKAALQAEDGSESSSAGDLPHQSATAGPPAGAIGATPGEADTAANVAARRPVAGDAKIK